MNTNPDPEVERIQEEAGVNLYDGDKELENLDHDHGLRRYYESVEKAARDKATHDRKLPTDMPAREAWNLPLHKE